jgi:hypothetical protein
MPTTYYHIYILAVVNGRSIKTVPIFACLSEHVPVWTIVYIKREIENTNASLLITNMVKSHWQGSM